MQVGVSEVVVIPGDFLVFTQATETPVELHIRNPLLSPISFRIKTNAPSCYNVSPSLGSIEPNSEATIKVTPKSPIEDSKSRHKFQILAAVDGGPEGQVALLGVKLAKKRESLVKFETAVGGGEDLGAELQRLVGRIKALDEDNGTLRRHVEDVRLKVVGLEHRKKFEQGREGVWEDGGYSFYHVVVAFLFGLILTRLFA